MLRATLPTTIEIVVDTNTASDVVHATPTEIQQIIMNLSTNAAHAMWDTGGTLCITLGDAEIGPGPTQSGLSPGSYLQLTVRDTGVGMTPEVMSRIFDPFFTTKEQGRGTGMGLSIVYGIMKTLGGNIIVESAPGAGSTFRLHLPKAMTDTESAAARRARIPEGTERILVVDDEELLTELGGSMLERLGYTVTATTDSTMALALFSADPFKFDLVITDQTMPGITGLNLARGLRNIRPDISVILWTGHDDHVNPETVRAAGIRECLMKPIVKEELALAIRRVLDGKSPA